MSSLFRVVADIYDRAQQKRASNTTSVLRDEVITELQAGRDGFLRCEGLLLEARGLRNDFIVILDRRQKEHEERLRKIQETDLFPGTDEHLAQTMDIERQAKEVFTGRGEMDALAVLLAKTSTEAARINCMMKELAKRQEIEMEMFFDVSVKLPLVGFLIDVNEALRKVSSENTEQTLHMEYMKKLLSGKTEELRDAFSKNKTFSEKVTNAVLIAFELPQDLASLVPKLLAVLKKFATHDYSEDEGIAAIRAMVPLATEYASRLSLIVNALRMLNSGLNVAATPSLETANKPAEPKP